MSDDNSVGESGEGADRRGEASTQSVEYPPAVWRRLYAGVLIILTLDIVIFAALSRYFA